LSSIASDNLPIAVTVPDATPTHDFAVADAVPEIRAARFSYRVMLDYFFTRN
jgi:hypothetical protein